MDHDQRLKSLLEKYFIEFIRLSLAEWLPRFDFSRLEWMKQEVFPNPPQGERRVVDVVVKVPVVESLPGEAHGGPQKWTALIHVEVEAADSLTAFRKRMYEYRTFLQGKYGLPVLPIALYLRVGLEGIGWDVYEEWLWEQQVGWFKYAYVGLPALDAFAHVNGDNLLATALSVLMKIPAGREAELKAEAMQRAAVSEHDVYRKHLLCECIEAYLPLEGPHLAEFERLLITPKYQEAAMVGQTSAEKGRVQERLEFVQSLLEDRFGSLPESVLVKLRLLTHEQRGTIGKGLLRGQSLKELGLED